MDKILSLARLLATPPHTIELIPGDGLEWLESFPDNPYSPFLFVEGNLGIPEKILYKTYMVAIQVLGEPKSYLQRLQQKNDVKEWMTKLEALQVTSVILLANPAHQTALNIRKTVIFSLGFEAEIEEACSAELGFISALLSIKQCAKVSILWHHRRTLLAKLHSTDTSDPLCTLVRKRYEERDDEIEKRGRQPGCPPIFTDEFFVSRVDLPLAALQTELNLASRACNLYPRNYFAWYHRTLCFQSCLASCARLRVAGSVAGYSNDNSVSAPRGLEAISALEKILQAELVNAKLWIERHVSDYSAVDYICRVGEAFEQISYSPSSTSENETTAHYAIDELARHALHLVRSYPAHETLWLYLRQTLLISTSHSPRRPALNEVRVQAEVIAREVLAEASHRCQMDFQSAADERRAMRSEAHIISRHTLRFLLWLHERMTNESDASKGYDYLNIACTHYRDACASPSTSSSDNRPIALLRSVSSIE